MYDAPRLMKSAARVYTKNTAPRTGVTRRGARGNRVVFPQKRLYPPLARRPGQRERAAGNSRGGEGSGHIREIRPNKTFEYKSSAGTVFQAKRFTLKDICVWARQRETCFTGPE